MIILIFLIIALIAFLFWYYYARTRVSFPSQQSALTIVKRSPYLQSFSQHDYKIRKTLNQKHLLSNYKLYLQEPTPSQKDRITFFCKQADDLFYNHKYYKIAGLKWNIILFSELENNMPHTHGEYIFLPIKSIPSTRKQSPRFIETLIHEKIHVYQRLYPDDVSNDAKSIGFTRNQLLQKDIYLPPDLESLRRKNPDFDFLFLWKKRYISFYLLHLQSTSLNDGEFILFDTKDYRKHKNSYRACIRSGKVYDDYIDHMNRMGLYKKEQMEHPYEILAYSISKKVMSLKLR